VPGFLACFVLAEESLADPLLVMVTNRKAVSCFFLGESSF
jgi:hypothetical protein